MIDSQQIYYKTKNNEIHFVDMSWQKDKTKPVMLNYKIFKNQSVIFNPIIYDPVNNELSTFISPNILKVFPNLNEYFKDAEGSKSYN